MPLSLSSDTGSWLWLGEPHRHKTLSPTLSHKLSAPQTFTLLTRPSSDAVQAIQHLVLADRVISSRWGARRAAVSGIHGFEGSLQEEGRAASAWRRVRAQPGGWPTCEGRERPARALVSDVIFLRSSGGMAFIFACRRREESAMVRSGAAAAARRDSRSQRRLCGAKESSGACGAVLERAPPACLSISIFFFSSSVLVLRISLRNKCVCGESTVARDR